MKSFLMMLSFLTRIPVSSKLEYNENKFIAGIKFIPAIGLLIGAILYFVSLLMVELKFDKIIICIIIQTIYVLITGGLHIDGLMDTFDGIYSNRNRSKMLEIMEDSRVGSFGVLGLILLLAINISTLYFLPMAIIITVPLVGRTIVLIIFNLNRYAKDDGMGKIFVENSNKKDILYGIVVMIAVVIALRNQVDYKIFIFAIAISTLLTIYLVRKKAKLLNGITGDVVGYGIEIGQMIYILSYYIMYKVL